MSRPLKLTPLQSLKAGLPVGEPARFSHMDWVRDAPDAALDYILKTYGKQNLKDQSDDETRWKSKRLKAVRFEIRRRALNLHPAAR